MAANYNNSAKKYEEAEFPRQRAKSGVYPSGPGHIKIKT